MSETLELAFPQLLGTVTATVGQRFARRIAAMGLVTLVASASAFGLPKLPLPLPVFNGSKVVPAVLVAVVAMAMINLLFVAASGRLPTDFLLGLRCVGIDGRRHGGWSVLHELLVMLSVVTTGGILPTILLLSTGDARRRSWIDRRLGLVVLNVRAGRDVVDSPVRPSEIADRLRVKPGSGPAIVEVGGASGRVSFVGPSHNASSAPELRYRLRFDDGGVVTIWGATLLGRGPAMSPPNYEVNLVPVPDPTLSKTHMLLIAEPDGVLVRDLGSTNGTVVVRPREAPLVVGTSTAVLAPVGSVIRWGERGFTIDAREA